MTAARAARRVLGVYPSLRLDLLIVTACKDLTDLARIASPLAIRMTPARASMLVPAPFLTLPPHETTGIHPRRATSPTETCHRRRSSLWVASTTPWRRLPSTLSEQNAVAVLIANNVTVGIGICSSGRC